MAPTFKQFEIRQSTIPDAGRGLFLNETADHGEEIVRYSGKLLSKAQMMESNSKYIIRIAENKYLCAQGKYEWDGRIMNCARKAKRKYNARFQVNAKCNCLL